MFKEHDSRGSGELGRKRYSDKLSCLHSSGVKTKELSSYTHAKDKAVLICSSDRVPASVLTLRARCCAFHTSLWARAGTNRAIFVNLGVRWQNNLLQASSHWIRQDSSLVADGREDAGLPWPTLTAAAEQRVARLPAAAACLNVNDASSKEYVYYWLICQLLFLEILFYLSLREKSELIPKSMASQLYCFVISQLKPELK